MKHQMKMYLILTVFLSGVLLFSSCSKDKRDNPGPTDPVEEGSLGTASATIFFTDTEETLQFTGISIGSIGVGEQADTVALVLSGKNSPTQFFLYLAPAKKGKLVMGEDGFDSFGWFNKDTAHSNISHMYLLGAENFPENGSIKDAATFNITSISKDRIKGTFTATMVSNSTIVENGEVTSGEIKTVEITHGKFDVPLLYGVDSED